MRLTEYQRHVIREAAAELFGVDTVVKLFGSRVDDELKGGDIDLLVQSDTRISDRLQKSLQFVARLQMRLGDQPIDVVVVDPDVKQQAIHIEAIRTGVVI